MNLLILEISVPVLTSVIAAVSGLLGALIGGGISYFLQNQKHKNDLLLAREENKTEFMAESTAKHFLSHKGYTHRTFKTLKKHLGGFDDNELRKILVRAGAMRSDLGSDEEERWILLSRMEEYIDKVKKS